jgi:hypothetical protein
MPSRGTDWWKSEQPRAAAVLSFPTIWLNNFLMNPLVSSEPRGDIGPKVKDVKDKFVLATVQHGSVVALSLSIQAHPQPAFRCILQTESLPSPIPLGYGNPIT